METPVQIEFQGVTPGEELRVSVLRHVEALEGRLFESSDRREIYFHRNSVLNDGFSRLAPGSRVTFFEEAGEKGAQASTVKLLGRHGLR